MFYGHKKIRQSGLGCWWPPNPDFGENAPKSTSEWSWWLAELKDTLGGPYGALTLDNSRISELQCLDTVCSLRVRGDVAFAFRNHKGSISDLKQWYSKGIWDSISVELP